MPRSSALCMTLRDASRSIRSPPKLLQPSPTRETLRPDLPRLRCCIGFTFSRGRRRYANGTRIIARTWRVTLHSVYAIQKAKPRLAMEEAEEFAFADSGAPAPGRAEWDEDGPDPALIYVAPGH